MTPESSINATQAAEAMAANEVQTTNIPPGPEAEVALTGEAFLKKLNESNNLRSRSPKHFLDFKIVSRARAERVVKIIGGPQARTFKHKDTGTVSVGVQFSDGYMAVTEEVENNDWTAILRPEVQTFLNASPSVSELERRLSRLNIALLEPGFDTPTVFALYPEAERAVIKRLEDKKAERIFADNEPVSEAQVGAEVLDYLAKTSPRFSKIKRDFATQALHRLIDRLEAPKE